MINRFLARTGTSALALAGLTSLLTLAPAPARAGTPPKVWFLGTRLAFPTAQMRNDQMMVATTDPGLTRLLERTGATLSYDASQRYVVVTSADHRAIAFTVGHPEVKAGKTEIFTPVAPYVEGTTAYLPLFTLAQALYLEPTPSNGETVLQPQIGELVVRTEGATTLVTLHSAIPISFRRLSGEGNEGVSLSLDGVSSELVPMRKVASGSLREIDLYAGGDARHPTTTVNFDPRGSARARCSATDHPTT